MTPQEQLIQAKAKELSQLRSDAGADGNFVPEVLSVTESFLTAFAAQIEADTREEDAKICEEYSPFVRDGSSGKSENAAYKNVAELIRSKITTKTTA